MKKIILGIAMLAFLGACAPKQQSNTLVCYNVRCCSTDQNGIDYDYFAQIIGDLNPDFVSLQELDSMTVRSGQTSTGHQLAERLGMHFTFASAIDFSGGKYGIGLLSRQKPISTSKIYLPSQSERRALLVAQFEDQYIAVTHLPLSESERVEAVRLIKEHVGGIDDKPLVLSGDFNADPDSEPISQILAYFSLLSDTTQFTYSAQKPSVTIDYVFGLNNGASYSVESFEVLPIRDASDHMPLVIKYTI